MFNKRILPGGTTAQPQPSRCMFAARILPTLGGTVVTGANSRKAPPLGQPAQPAPARLPHLQRYPSFPLRKWACSCLASTLRDHVFKESNLQVQLTWERASSASANQAYTAPQAQLRPQITAKAAFKHASLARDVGLPWLTTLWSRMA